MKRQAEQALHHWKYSEFRKPLLVYGARQVGKTWLMKHFGAENFRNYLYINFEKEVSLRGIFEEDYNPQRIVKVLEIFTNSTIIPGETLLLFDEIHYWELHSNNKPRSQWGKWIFSICIHYPSLNF